MGESVTDSISFVVPGAPTGKGRPRFTKTGHAYTPKETVSRENLIASEAMRAWRRPPSDEAFTLSVLCILPIPKSWPLKKRLAAIEGALPAASGVDADNALKSVGDALNQIVWRDDRQVIRATVEKRYGETPATHVRVEIVRGK